MEGFAQRPGSRKQKKVDRDYTPLSSLSEWAGGTMAILIKVYPDGKATSWLHSQPPGSQAPPTPTLRTAAAPVFEGRNAGRRA